MNNYFTSIDELQTRLESAECRISNLEHWLSYLESAYQQQWPQQFHHSQYNIPIPHGEYNMQGSSGLQLTNYRISKYNQQIYGQDSQQLADMPFHGQAPKQLADLGQSLPNTTLYSQSPPQSANPGQSLSNTTVYNQAPPQSANLGQSSSSTTRLSSLQVANVPTISQDSQNTSKGPMLAINNRSGNYLPSSVINLHLLHNVDQVICQNHKLCTEASAGTLCQILARECFFGKDVMEQCTPNSARDCPGLPRQELNALKTKMFHLFPRFQSCPEQFEI